MPSKAYQNYHRNNVKIYKLLKAYHQVKGTARGKRDLDYFAQSAILMLSASWETYVEDVIFESAHYLTSKLSTSSQLPEFVVEALLKSVKGDDFSKVFRSTPGWNEVYLNYAEVALYGNGLNKWGLNTPKPNKVDDLCRQILGTDECICDWRENQTLNIKKFVELRGTFAHKGKRQQYYNMDVAIGYLGMVDETVRAMDYSLYLQLLHLTTFTPWNYSYTK